VRIHS